MQLKVKEENVNQCEANKKLHDILNHWILPYIVTVEHGGMWRKMLPRINYI